MKVLKFGGTSVGSATRLKQLPEILDLKSTQIVVLSALSGTTDTLLRISMDFASQNREEALKKIKDLQDHYFQVINQLFDSEELRLGAQKMIEEHFNTIQELGNDLVTPIEEKIIIAQGELISTELFYYFLINSGIECRLVSALEFMCINEDNEPNFDLIKKNIKRKFPNSDSPLIYITQGFICRNSFGGIDNLKRGGSDYSASLIGAALEAEEIQIWTDIDGIHNNDPRIVAGTHPIHYLSFEEAAELAYFGAKILHPQSILPAQKANIPVRILNTLKPDQEGTLIYSKENQGNPICAVAAKDGIIAIHIHSSRMLMAYGFLRRVFEVFERYKTPIDMITTSEVGVSLTIDNSNYLEEIMEDLKSFGHVDSDKSQTIVCVVGNFNRNTHGYAAMILDAVKHLPIQMISYGGSDHNVSFLLPSKHKKEALRSLQRRLF